MSAYAGQSCTRLARASAALLLRQVEQHVLHTTGHAASRASLPGYEAHSLALNEFVSQCSHVRMDLCVIQDCYVRQLDMSGWAGLSSRRSLCCLTSMETQLHASGRVLEDIFINFS